MEQIELRKARDFGELINDSFLFIKGNFKPLLRCSLSWQEHWPGLRITSG